MSAANRNRGARAEVQVVNFLRSQGWEDARRYLAGDGRQPGDIDWHESPSDLRIRAIMGPENTSGPGAALTAPDRGQHLAGGAVMAHRTCSIEGCKAKHYGRGLCSRHYQWHRRRGILPEDRKPTTAERFWQKVEKSPGGCWLWVGTILPSGYGQFRVGLGHARAHRFAYELLVGEIPGGLTIDHLCRNTRCVNPNHLEPVTAAENVRRAVAYR